MAVRKARGGGKGWAIPSEGLRTQFRDEIIASNEPGVPVGLEEFETWVRGKAERELWFFSRWILDNTWLGEGRFHRDEACRFLTDYSKGRRKLLMLPMGHLKTTVASRSMPLHLMVQPQWTNIYEKGRLGRNYLILLANENEQKSRDNLRVTRENLESNWKIHWLWPQICWPNLKDASPWTDSALTIPRSVISAEPTLRSVGANTGFIGSYYDVIIADDIATLAASDSPAVMEKVKRWREASKTRLRDKIMGIYIGVGTHWASAEDVYTVWKKEKNVQVMLRAILEPDENGQMRPLWPEHYPMPVVEAMRADIDPVLWATGYMNQQSTGGYTTLRWDDVRQYKMMADAATGKTLLEFADNPLDELIDFRQTRRRETLGFKLGNPIDEMKLRREAPQGYDEAYVQHLKWKHPERIPADAQARSDLEIDEGFFGRK